MNKFTEAQFGILCDLYQGSSTLYGASDRTLDRLREGGMILREGTRSWSLTEAGRTFVDGRGLELSKPDFGDLSAVEKRVILDKELFPESDRRRLMFDRIDSVAACAIRSFDLTEEEFIRLGDSPAPDARATALSLGREHLRNGEDLDRKLSNYLKHEDKGTVGAILKALNATGNIDFVGEYLVGRWLRSDIPTADVLQMLCQNQVKVSDGTLASLIDGHDPQVLGIVCLLMWDRLNSAQVDTILSYGNASARTTIATVGKGLSTAQIRRLLKDDDYLVSCGIRDRLSVLEEALKIAAKPNDLVTLILVGCFREAASS